MAQNLLLITFDVPGARGGDPRYKQADRYLESIGVVTRPFHQVRLVLTRTPPSKITRAMTAIVGVAAGVLAVRLSRPYRFVLGNNHKLNIHRPAVAALLRQHAQIDLDARRARGGGALRIARAVVAWTLGVLRAGALAAFDRLTLRRGA